MERESETARQGERTIVREESDGGTAGREMEFEREGEGDGERDR